MDVKTLVYSQKINFTNPDDMASLIEASYRLNGFGTSLIDIEIREQQIRSAEAQGLMYTIAMDVALNTGSMSKAIADGEFTPFKGSSEDTGIFKSTSELEAHIIYRDTSVPIKKGIGGSHNEAEFLKNDVKIIDYTPSTTVHGVSKVEYNMPKLDGSTYPAKLIPGEYGSTQFSKTVYNPDIISDSEFMRRGLEAANNAVLRDGTLPVVWEGVDSLNVKWTGYYRFGKIDSFFTSN